MTLWKPRVFQVARPDSIEQSTYHKAANFAILALGSKAVDHCNAREYVVRKVFLPILQVLEYHLALQHVVCLERLNNTCCQLRCWWLGQSAD